MYLLTRSPNQPAAQERICNIYILCTQVLALNGLGCCQQLRRGEGRDSLYPAGLDKDTLPGSSVEALLQYTPQPFSLQVLQQAPDSLVEALLQDTRKKKTLVIHLVLNTRALPGARDAFRHQEADQ